MKPLMLIVVFALLSSPAFAQRPAVYTELLDYVIEAPHQGKTGTCLYMGSTGAMEILANKHHGLTHQRPGDRFDLAERFLIFQKSWRQPGHRVEAQVRKFNWGKAIHSSEIPFVPWREDGEINTEVWKRPAGYSSLPRISVPKIETQKLFVRGGKWDTFVIKKGDIEAIKQALWRYRSPILVNVNDTRYWHVLNIVGYDDTLQDQPCYDNIPQVECDKTQEGAFYVRDHFGVATELRDTDWFRVKGNAAFVVKLAQ